MVETKNIVIGDHSALHALMHRDWTAYLTSPQTQENPFTRCAQTQENPFNSCAQTIKELSFFNTNNALYGPKPIVVLVPKHFSRRFTNDITCRFVAREISDYPSAPRRSFIQLREGLYITSPELTYLRMADFVGVHKLAAIGTDLCGRYFIDDRLDEYPQRKAFITTPERIMRYCSQLPQTRGSKKALEALKWVRANSGSPAETKLFLLLSISTRQGGFGLPFTHLNYDENAGALARFTDQFQYSIDIANPEMHIGIEYDGLLYHTNSSRDKRRRNELHALGWDIFPVDRDVLQDADRMIDFAMLLAKHMGIRKRPAKCWHDKHTMLRKELGLKP